MLLEPSGTPRSVRRCAAAVGTAGLLVALAACGDDDEDGAASRDAEADLTVLAYDSNELGEDSYTADAGEVTIEYRNEGSITHTLVLDDHDLDLAVHSPDDRDVGTVELDAGEYRIYCDEPGHTGMEATLVVE